MSAALCRRLAFTRFKLRMDRSPEEAEALAASLVQVRDARDIARLPPDTDGVLIVGLSDDLVGTLAHHRPGVRHIFGDGNSHAFTDHGLESLARLTALESLDLEYSAITDAGLDRIAAVSTLRWLDLGGCEGVTKQGLARLRTQRPDLEIEPNAA